LAKYKLEDLLELLKNYNVERLEDVKIEGDLEIEIEGGSLYSKIMGFESYNIPRTSPERLKSYSDALLESFRKFDVKACHDVSEGGIAVAIAEMSFGLGVGFKAVKKLDFVELFSESNTRWIVEIKEEELEGYLDFLKRKGLRAEHLGFSEGSEIDFGSFSCDLAQADNAWRTGIRKYLG